MNSQIQSVAVVELRKEAERLKEEFESYLEDLRLFSNPGFWKAVEEAEKANKHLSIQEYAKKMGV
jgi:hypothetical protein